ncbi:hypothetical protein D029_3624 [Vibrio parahaemolyticus 970107]|nr:hypothetical protein D029_3624 [Vibrio parahaemolyticus 970107]
MENTCFSSMFNLCSIDTFWVSKHLNFVYFMLYAVQLCEIGHINV